MGQKRGLTIKVGVPSSWGTPYTQINWSDNKFAGIKGYKKLEQNGKSYKYDGLTWYDYQFLEKTTDSTKITIKVYGNSKGQSTEKTGFVGNFK